MDPRQMKKLMKQMNVEEIEADEVIIRSGEKEIVFENPKVSKMKVMGQESWQIVGSPVERAAEEEGEEEGEGDIEMIMEQAGVDVDAAKKALEASSGDIAQAIIDLKDN